MAEHPVPLPSALLLTLMAQQRYGVEFQPIVETRSNGIFAYEALSRFYREDGQPLRPDWVYASLHDSPLSLFQVELAQKRLQLEHAPPDYPLFVNLDQDAYHACGEHGDANPFIRLVQERTQGSVIVELIENTEINDAVVSMDMIHAFTAVGVPVAIDDVGAPHSMISLSIVQLVDFIKFDSHLIRNQDNVQCVALARALIDYARTVNKQVIFEGVESEADLAFARRLGADYVQGFLFRDRFIQVP